MEFWRGSVFYEIYMKSFQDSNGDGLGDFKGLTSRLDYLADLGIDGIWLTPFYPSQQVDNGYDVSDYCEINPDYGNMTDFREFMKAADARGIKVIIDLVLNHSSTEHAWFKESRMNKTNPKRDYYIWREKPNNWESFFGGSAWELDELTGEYYYHSFAKEQADLNWANQAVQAEMEQVLAFWLNEGVAGFRLDVINNLTLVLEFPDNPVVEGEMEHVYDRNQRGLEQALEHIATFCRKEREVFLVGEISSDKLPEIAKYSSKKMLDVTFNFNFGSVEQIDAKSVFTSLNEMETELQEGQWPTLFFGSHDMSRYTTRLADGNLIKTKLLAFLMLTAKGVPFIYYGEEMGMPDLTFSSVEEMRDIQGTAAYYQALQRGKAETQALESAIEKTRDKARGPMVFPDGKPFTSGEPWIKTASLQEKEALSMWHFYKELLTFRKEQDFKDKEYTSLKLDGEILSYQRGKILFLLHFGEGEVVYPFRGQGRLVFGEADMLETGIKIGAHAGIALRVED
ncbi:alpha-amylase family glycosyl hydrolase [Listeria swaminathanii]|uniref:Alpha-amylase family glycosyl hydrolase n=1 Tax=Listeria swaminathanii TaxID=2713501 RepID=A0ABU2ID19_9LIST|nr:alpha-amylase family glycosyl hydrolase [Listeria swaminathanii]MDT0016147.1 alpha-amylase family glycosyl hydrolase [Listeria swaminathanii]MDT0021583.1 alpha-amylase family glycosyl hydrolase [Listeria swaminathanii]MDT0032547.1 alpha-amylase family glycosyl hydrolase [Listeria swaminathanii]MDT0051603.1 alpha-amylase family glycosyl hydrolase [Listeria swaminathanii]MDT0054368.1 alpha-amylase family glycosyl hydrolase [Listeria swaminathanii]